MARIIAVLLALVALVVLLVALLAGTHDAEEATDDRRWRELPPVAGAEEPAARAPPRERVRVVDVPSPAPSLARAPEETPPPNLRASQEIGEDDDLVPLRATIRPSDRSATTATLPVSVSLAPATTRFSVMLGVVPDAGTVRVSGEYQIITHAPGGEVFIPSGVAKNESELVTIDESTGVISGIANSLSAARQSAGEATSPQGEVVGHSTGWGRLTITFEVSGTPYSMSVTVPKFESGRARSVQIFDGPSSQPSGR